jgi:hypothetical protein
MPIIFSAQLDIKGFLFPGPGFVRKSDVVFEAAIFLFFATIFDNYLLFHHIIFSRLQTERISLKFTPKNDVGISYAERDYVCVLNG